MNFCPECGLRLMHGAKFCSECGERLTVAGAVDGSTSNTELSDESLRAKAEAGDAEAIKDVGLRYERAGDLDAARRWYQRAADLGHAGAVRNLGVLRVQVDDHEGALACFVRAADSGSQLMMDRNSVTNKSMVHVAARAASQAALELLKLGRMDEAEKWIVRSRQMGDDQATAFIAAYQYEKPDLTQALEWSVRASDEGEVRGTALVLSILGQQQRVIEMAPYLIRYLEADVEFQVLPRESIALFARLVGMQFAIESETDASLFWLEQAKALGDSEAARLLAPESDSTFGLSKQSHDGLLGSNLSQDFKRPRQ